MGPTSIVHEATEDPGQAVNSCVCTGLLLVTGSVFLYRTREHSFHVDVYLLCFRQHFQPDLWYLTARRGGLLGAWLSELGLSALGRLGGRI